jgi:hypothetical protein
MVKRSKSRKVKQTKHRSIKPRKVKRTKSRNTKNRKVKSTRSKRKRRSTKKMKGGGVVYTVKIQNSTDVDKHYTIQKKEYEKLKAIVPTATEIQTKYKEFDTDLLLNINDRNIVKRDWLTTAPHYTYNNNINYWVEIIDGKEKILFSYWNMMPDVNQLKDQTPFHDDLTQKKIDDYYN